MTHIVRNTLLPAMLTLSCMFLYSNTRAQTQTEIGFLDSYNSPTLLLANVTLCNAFETDCDMDSASDYHSATFTVAGIEYRDSDWYLVGYGSNSTYSYINRYRLLALSGGAFFLSKAKGPGPTCSGSCAACHMTGNDCACTDPMGGTCKISNPGPTSPSNGYLDSYGGGWDVNGPGHIGNLY